MNSPDSRTPDEFDVALSHLFHNWADQQTPPAYARNRVLKKAARNAKVDFGRYFLITLKRLNPYWTGRPLNHTELTKWLFSQAMLQCFSMDRRALRMLC